MPQVPITPPIENTGGKALRVNGKHIEYGIGDDFQTVVLRGVNVGDLYHFSKFDIDPPDFSYIKNTLNANVVRIAVHPNFWKNEKQRTLACLKENVRNALAAGLFVIVDYHTIGYPNGYAQKVPRNEIIAYISDFSLARNFWDTISREIFDGRVLYEMWNEPASERYDLSYTQRWNRLKPSWEELIAIIRRNGSKNIIIAGGDIWTHELQGIRDNLLADSNTVYAWHMYANEHDNLPAEWELMLGGLYNVRPVIVTEWGFSDEPGDEVFDPAPPNSGFAVPFVEQFLKGKNLHSTAWGYDPFYGPNMLVDGNYRRLNRYGQFVMAYLNSSEQIFAD